MPLTLSHHLGGLVRGFGPNKPQHGLPVDAILPEQLTK
jgi:hypothetical protein